MLGDLATGAEQPGPDGGFGDEAGAAMGAREKAKPWQAAEVRALVRTTTGRICGRFRSYWGTLVCRRRSGIPRSRWRI